MMNNYSVILKNISKKYDLILDRNLFIENILGISAKKSFWALKDINIKLKKGERLGILGRNGSGKTTLLRVIAGITKPTNGTVMISGKVVSIIELEAGFHPELSGYENIRLNALLLGMSLTEINLKMQDIVNFSELGEFIHMPFYTYSSGMRLRLGFSVAAFTKPEVLVLDENMSVGDKKFRHKTYQRIKDFARSGSTIVIATHSLTVVRKLCTHALLIEDGRIQEFGTTKKVIDKFWKLYRKER